MAGLENAVPPRLAGNVGEWRGLWGSWGAAMPPVEGLTASDLRGIPSREWGPALPDLLCFQESLEMQILVVKSLGLLAMR